MVRNYIIRGLQILGVLYVILIVYACANMATPTGGPYDETPPRFVSSNPAPNQTNFTGKKVEILFDELIQIDNPQENVIITPPQIMNPIIRAQGRRAVVEFQDTMKLNTTYTIDFTNSIADNNEKNQLENFTFAFSTGDVIDSLEISGILLNARDLEPVSGVTIGLHINLDDSAFVTEPFLRTSRTNDRGRFTIRNIAPGTYRVYALKDLNRNYLFDQPGEEIAFLEEEFTPTFELATRNDTLWLDSLTIDTIHVVEYNRFLPDDILLRFFQEDYERQYMLRPERSEENRFTLRFNAVPDSIPVPVPLNFTPPDSIWYIPQIVEEGKGITYWLTDSVVWKRDTLELEVNYPASDSLNNLVPRWDTVQAVIRRNTQPESRRRKKDAEEEEIVFLGMQVNATGTRERRDTVSILFDEPVRDFSPDLLHLSIKEDSVWVPVDFNFFPDSTNTLNYFLRRSWKYGEEYRLDIDSATIYSMYGKWNAPYTGEFKIRNEDEYGNLYIRILGVDTTAFVELLNGSDVPVRTAAVRNGGVLFMDLRPDKYYARLVIDLNNNGMWDTGNYEEKRQPEDVYYSPKQYEIMQNFNVEETWDVFAQPLEKQKPAELIKNKPKEPTPQRRRN